MVIEKLEIKGFGRINGLILKLGKGLNIIYGSNESGKTTLQWFIKAMLYGLKGGKASKDGLPPPLKRFKPWNGTGFGGVMEYRLDDGCLYRVERNFDDNSVEVYDANFNDISGSFDASREKGLIFAEKQMGLNETCFEKTVLIRQMETRLDEDGSRELLSRLANISQTGFEDVSFKKTKKALEDALIKYVGTDRSTTRPVDRIAARLEELDAARTGLAGNRNTLLNTEYEWNEALAQKQALQKRKEYLEKVKELIECRKQLDEQVTKESGLKEALRKLQEAEADLAFACEEHGRLKDRHAAAYLYAGNRNSRKKVPDNRLAYAIAVLAFLASAISGVYGFLKNPAGIAGAVLLLIAAFAMVVRLKRRRNAPEEAGLMDEQAAGIQQEYKNKTQEIIELNIQLKDICSKASLLYGKQVDSARDASTELSENAAMLGVLKSRLEGGISGALKVWDGITSEFFETGRLDGILHDSGLKWLEDSFGYEMDKVGQGLVDTALKIKECETLLKNYREDGDELQRIDEETAELKSKKDSLEETGTSLKLALDVLCEASSEIRRSFAPALHSRMSAVIDRLTGGRYRDLRADDFLALKTVSPDTGDVKPVSVLSGGTADQMYLALRLAMADLLVTAGEKPFLVMDEVFSQYDDTRTRNTLEYLYELTGDRQVILFTCKKREVDIAGEIYSDSLNLVEI